jgi:hypothetical protein
VRARFADLLVLLVSLLLMIVLVEGGYRVFLKFDLDQAREKLHIPDANPSFGFYGWPPPWKFDQRRGFSFSEGYWLEGRVVKGRFDGCVQSGPGNSHGNFGPLQGDPEKAALKIAVFGSSYTLMDNERNGNTSTNLLQAALEKRLGQSVVVLNYSRDATGLFTMFDIATDVIQEFQPDLMLFTFNVTALGYKRHWRTVRQSSAGFYRMYFNRDSTEVVSSDRSLAHVNPISKRVTPEWCLEMSKAKSRGDNGRLEGDPLMKEIIAEYAAIMRDRGVPAIAIDFWALNTSFVYNRLRKGDPYGGRNKLRESSAFWQPLKLQDYRDDQKFIDAIERIKRSKIPFEIVHLPTLPEFRLEVDYLPGSSGLTDDEQRRAVAQVEALTGRKVVHLLEYYDADRLRHPEKLVVSEADSHPSAMGEMAMAEAIENMLVRREMLQTPGSPANAQAKTSGQRTQQ